MDAAVVRKQRRLRDGGPPRVLDLFSGSGGLTLGFVTAGYRSIGGIEMDRNAATSYAMNFHPGAVEVHSVSRRLGRAGLLPGHPVANEDGVSPEALAVELRADPQTATLLADGFDDPSDALAIDVIVGGPPCPAFTRVGRAKFAAVLKHREKYLEDPRALLWMSYRHVVEYFRPVAVVLENVPDILRFGEQNVGDQITAALEALGYECRYTILNAASYGVPQLRDRFFLIGIHRAADAVPRFPEPTHQIELPSGYRHARAVARKLVPRQPSFEESGLAGRRMEEIPTGGPDAELAPAVTARQAIDDLPEFTGVSRGKDAGRSAAGAVAPPYRLSPQVSYQHLMREWPGLAASTSVRDHLTRRLTDRDFWLFAQMTGGEDYPAAIRRAEARLAAEVHRVAGPEAADADRQALTEQLRPRFVPPYPVATFPNRWRKMEADAPARTLMAHLGKDTYSHIHYDSGQARTITVREAARLQSFPDAFVFAGRMNAQFRQIGNAVPPLLAYRIALALRQACGWPAIGDPIGEVLARWSDEHRTATQPEPRAPAEHAG